MNKFSESMISMIDLIKILKAWIFLKSVLEAGDTRVKNKQ